MIDRRSIEASLSRLPKCQCGEPATISEKNGLSCAPCSLEKNKVEIALHQRTQAAIAADEARREKRREQYAVLMAEKKAEAARAEEIEIARQALLSRAQAEALAREATLATDDRETLDMNRALIEKYRQRRIDRELALLERGELARAA